MALSKKALMRAVNSVPEGDDVGVWVVGVCRAVESEVRKDDTELIRQLLEALDGSIAITMAKIDMRNEAIAAGRARLGDVELTGDTKAQLLGRPAEPKA